MIQAVNGGGGAVVGSPDDSGRGVVALSLDSVGGSPDDSGGEPWRDTFVIL